MKDFLVAVPKIEAPKGGGGIRGISEKFYANSVTGTAGFTVPLALSPGRGGAQTARSLSYDSGGGNGTFGLGWSLSVPAIRRKSDKVLQRHHGASDGDTFVMSDAEDVVHWPALTVRDKSGVEHSIALDMQKHDSIESWMSR